MALVESVSRSPELTPVTPVKYAFEGGYRAVFDGAWKPGDFEKTA